MCALILDALGTHTSPSHELGKNGVLHNDAFHTFQQQNQPLLLYSLLAAKAINPDTGLAAELPKLLKCSDGAHWEESACQEWGRLAQGYKQVNGTDTLHFIPFSQLPTGQVPTYCCVVATDCPMKENT